MENVSYPQDWYSVMLGELVTAITSGGTPTSGDPRYYVADGIPFAVIGDLTNSRHRYLAHTEQHISESALRDSSAKIFPEGTILVSMYGTIGLVKQLAKPIAINQAIAALVQPYKCVPEFLAHTLDYNAVKMRAAASQTTQANISATFLKSLQLILPKNPDEQLAIAKILNEADEEIRQTEQLIEKLKLARQGLLHDLLKYGLLPNGQPRDPNDGSLFKDSQLGRIPSEWAVEALEDLAEIGTGLTLGRDLEGVSTIELPYLRVANVQDGYLDLTEIKTTRVRKSEIPIFRLEIGDVLMNEGGDFDKLGRGAVWYGEIENCLHQNHVFSVRPNQAKILPEYLNAVTSSGYGKKFFLLSSKQSTNLASINKTQLRGFPVPLPGLSEQQRMIERLAAYTSRLSQEQRAVTKLRASKQGLMDDLLSGRVRIKD